VPSLPSLATSIAVAMLCLFSGYLWGHHVARLKYEAKIAAITNAAQQQKEHADEVSRQLARSLADLQDKAVVVRRSADLYRVSRAGAASCIGGSGLSIVNDALAGSKRTTRALPGSDAPR